MIGEKWVGIQHHFSKIEYCYFPNQESWCNVSPYKWKDNRNIYIYREREKIYESVDSKIYVSR